MFIKHLLLAAFLGKLIYEQLKGYVIKNIYLIMIKYDKNPKTKYVLSMFFAFYGCFFANKFC